MTLDCPSPFHLGKSGFFREDVRKRTTFPSRSIGGNELPIAAELLRGDGEIILEPAACRRALSGVGLVNMLISCCLPAFLGCRLMSARPRIAAVGLRSGGPIINW